MPDGRGGGVTVIVCVCGRVGVGGSPPTHSLPALLSAGPGGCVGDDEARDTSTVFFPPEGG